MKQWYAVAAVLCGSSWLAVGCTTPAPLGGADSGSVRPDASSDAPDGDASSDADGSVPAPAKSDATDDAVPSADVTTDADGSTASEASLTPGDSNAADAPDASEVEPDATIHPPDASAEGDSTPSDADSSSPDGSDGSSPDASSFQDDPTCYVSKLWAGDAQAGAEPVTRRMPCKVADDCVNYNGLTGGPPDGLVLDSAFATTCLDSFACIDGLCATHCKPAGYIPPPSRIAQNPETCRANVCDAHGRMLLRVIDPWNQPLHDVCINETCILGGGTIGNPNVVPAGTACGAGLTCATQSPCVPGVAGICRTACTGCVKPSDCGGVDTPCNVQTCNAGVCGRVFLPWGTPCSDAGDVCDGIGWCGLMPDGGFPPHY